jgi:Cellulase (glycosyl hydrolase family 5)
LQLQLIGVNFHGYESSSYQNRSTPPPPENYIENSFRIFADSGITCVRVTFYWESWELNRDRCLDDLGAIADSADKHGIACIYDNHQWECSSWIGNGIGMPNSVMSRYYEMTPAERAANYNTKKNFWNRWWNRKIETAGGKDGWDAQLSYFADIIRRFNNRKSTFGFEILNEPEVFSLSHYNKIRQYHDYMIKELRKITDKPLIFCWALPHVSFDNPILQARIFPAYHKHNNVIYDGHSYPLSRTRMIYFRQIRRLMGNVPLYVGEFNSGFTSGAVLNQDQLYEYINMCKRFEVYGCALWRWSYIHDQNVPAFNLARIVDGKIQPGTYFNYFVKAFKEAKIQLH